MINLYFSIPTVIYIYTFKINDEIRNNLKSILKPLDGRCNGDLTKKNSGGVKKINRQSQHAEIVKTFSFDYLISVFCLVPYAFVI